jgi:hypothetical protein
MAKDSEKEPTLEEIAAKVARALLRIPAPEKKRRRTRPTAKVAGPPHSKAR